MSKVKKAIFFTNGAGVHEIASRPSSSLCETRGSRRRTS